MKKKLLSVGFILAIVAVLFAFTKNDDNVILQGAITGTISPADGAEAVWAIKNGGDTTKGTLTQGKFSVDVKPGSYTLIVDAKDPYKDVSVNNLEVADKPVDVGEIILQQ
jgi:hypothetical protein